MQPYNAEAGSRAQATEAMERLAASTGGKAFYNTNDLSVAIQKAVDDGGHYYSIGYSSADETMDGSFRRIDVKVRQGKYKLAYRHGYNAEERPPTDPNTRLDPLSDLLGYGLPAATGILYGVDVKEDSNPLAQSRAGDNPALQGPLKRYHIDFTIRATDVELTPDGHGSRSGRLIVGLKAYDRDGLAANWEATDETLSVKESEYLGALKNGVPVHLVIDLPANADQHLVTAVYDWNSGRAGTLEAPLMAKRPD
jgi:hypothetical protein